MSLQSIQERLAQLQHTTAHLRVMIDRLASPELQPGPAATFKPSRGGNADGGKAGLGADLVAELTADITLSLRESKEDLEVLQEQISYLPAGRPGGDRAKANARLGDAAVRVGQELKSCRLSFHKAQLSARESLAAAQKSARAAILASYAKPPPPPSPAVEEEEDEDRHPRQDDLDASSEDDDVIGAAHDVTASLRRTHDLMATELAKSAYAAETMAESTAALASLGERYEGLDDLVSKSRDLLGTLMRSQKSDSWYLQTALYILLATAAWLVFRRLLYGPLWYLVWLPLKLLGWTAGTGVSTAISLAGRRAHPSPSSSFTVEVGGRGKVEQVANHNEKQQDKNRQAVEETLVETICRTLDGTRIISYGECGLGDALALL